MTDKEIENELTILDTLYAKPSYSKFIVIEGIDGSGKSTIVDKIEEVCNKSGIGLNKVSFPNYKDMSGDLIKRVLKRRYIRHMSELNPYAFSALYAVDRWLSINKEYIEAFFRSTYPILSDRWTQSNLIHQGSNLINGLNPDLSEEEYKKRTDILDEYCEFQLDFEFNKMKLPKPDTVIYLDTPLETCLDRLEHKEYRDINEQTDPIINAYYTGKYLANKYNWNIVDTDGCSVEDIAKKIFNIIF